MPATAVEKVSRARWSIRSESMGMRMTAVMRKRALTVMTHGRTLSVHRAQGALPPVLCPLMLLTS
jgi:hypothetical protein